MPNPATRTVGGLCVLLILAAGAVWSQGCAGGAARHQGGAAQDQDRHADAIPILESRIEAGSAAWDTHRDLGVAYLETGSPEQALIHLEKARSLRPDDEETVFHLGSALEALGRIEEALEVYRAHAEAGSPWPLGSGFGRKIRQRVSVLMRRQAADLVRSRIEEESRSPEYALAPGLLAVIPFQAAGPSEQSSPLAAAMAHWLATDLSQVEALTLVERIQIDAILQELHLAEEQERLDPATAPRLGRLLGAERVLGGALARVAGDNVRVDISLADTRSGEIQLAENASGPLERFFEVEKRLVFAVLAGLGIEPSPMERSRIEHVPTRDLSAALAFGRGLLAERRGEYDEAHLAYQEALDHDSGFALAGLALQDLPAAEDAEKGEAETEGKEAVGPTAATSPPDSDLMGDDGDRLDAMDEIVVGDIWMPDPSDQSPWEQDRGIPDPPLPPDPER